MSGPADFDTVRASIGDIWAQVLGHRQFTSDTNFFDVGGNSMLLARVLGPVNALRAPEADEIRLLDLFEDATVSGIAARVLRPAPEGTQR